MSTTTTITPEDIQTLDLYLSITPTFICISLAATTLLSWELILTFPHEVRLWNSKWTPVKVLFLLNRYFALGTSILITFLTFDITPTEAVCSVNAHLGIIVLLLVANIELILQHRLYALYGYDRRIVIPVLALFIAIFSIMMVMAVILVNAFELIEGVAINETDQEIQFVGSCTIVSAEAWLHLLWVPMMALDFVLVVLASYKSLQHYLQVPDRTWSGARLMRTFARDSILYFLCNFLVYLFSTLMGKFGPPEYYQLPAIAISIIPSISVNRLIINMYDSAHPNQTSWTVISETKASQQGKGVSRVDDDVELPFINIKGLRHTEGSLDDAIF